MNLVLGFMPFILFDVLVRLSVDVALWAAFAAAFALGMRSFLDTRVLKTLDGGNTALFGVLALYKGFIQPALADGSVLLAVDSELRRNGAVSLAEAAMHFEQRRQVFASTLGSLIDQTRYLSGAGFSALSYKDGEIQKRSYPNSFGGQYQLKGYELVDELRLLENAPRVAEEAVALHAADQCPEGEFDLILDSSQLGLQIHESIGHPIELDRVLGSEANYAGMSFLTLDQLNRLRYGSEIVNVVCDARPEHGPGLGTFAFDDEGVRLTV